MASPAVKIAILAEAAQARAELKGAGQEAEAAASKLAGTAEAADNLGSKSERATGALGALSSGFELVGLGAYAEGLNQAALATDFMSGVGDSLNLILELQVVQSARAKAAAAAHAVATTAQSAATRAAAVAQGALNVVMSLNPIGLVIIAIIALVAAFVIAYKRSETFRNIVQRAMAGVVAAGRAVATFFTVTVPAAFEATKRKAEAVREFVTGLPGKFRAAFNGAITWLRSAGRNMIEGLIGGIREKVQDAIDAAKRVVQGAIDAAKNLLGISSPSRVFRRIGEQTGEGLAEGIRRRAGLAKRAGSALSSAVAAGFTPPELAPATAAYASGAGGVAAGRVYQVNVSVPPTASLVDVGRTVVKAIRAYEGAGGRTG